MCCLAAAAAWLWPAGVPVVLLTGGEDRICNEFWNSIGLTRAARDAAYLDKLWRAVPAANQQTTAILHLPQMSHRPDWTTLGDVLPALVRWCASGLSTDLKPTAKAMGCLQPCTLVTVAEPEGEVLVPLDPLGRAYAREDGQSSVVSPRLRGMESSAS